MEERTGEVRNGEKVKKHRDMLEKVERHIGMIEVAIGSGLEAC